MLTGKAVLLLDSALIAMIVSDQLNVNVPYIAPAQDITEMEEESSTALSDKIVSYMKQKRHVPGILARQHRQTSKQLEICSMTF